MIFGSLTIIQYHYPESHSLPAAMTIHGRSSISFGSSQADITSYNAAYSLGLPAENSKMIFFSQKYIYHLQDQSNKASLTN